MLFLQHSYEIKVPPPTPLPILTMRTFGTEKKKQRLSVIKDESGRAEVETQEFLASPYIQMFSFKRYFNIKKCCSISQSKYNELFISQPPLGKALLFIKALWTTKWWSQLFLCSLSSPKSVYGCESPEGHPPTLQFFFLKNFPNIQLYVDINLFHLKQMWKTQWIITSLKKLLRVVPDRFPLSVSHPDKTKQTPKLDAKNISQARNFWL